MFILGSHFEMTVLTFLVLEFILLSTMPLMVEGFFSFLIVMEISPFVDQLTSTSIYVISMLRIILRELWMAFTLLSTFHIRFNSNKFENSANTVPVRRHQHLVFVVVVCSNFLIALYFFYTTVHKLNSFSDGIEIFNFCCFAVINTIWPI